MVEARALLAPTEQHLDEMAARLVPRLELLAELVERTELQRAGRGHGCEWPMEQCASSCGQHLPPVEGERRLGWWRSRAACAERPDLDFVVAPGEAEQEVCARCPVRGACHDYAAACDEAVGLHAGKDWRSEVRMRLGKKR